MAGAGPLDGTGYQCQGLPAGAGLHPYHYTDLHIREPPHRRVVFRDRSPHPAMKKLLFANKLAVSGFLIAGLLVIAALLAPWLIPYDPSVQDLPDRLEGPSYHHPLGNDELGRDILSRLLIGARVSMRVGGTVVLLSGVAGVLIGGLAGYAGGKLDIFITVI